MINPFLININDGNKNAAFISLEIRQILSVYVEWKQTESEDEIFAASNYTETPFIWKVP